MNNHLDCLLEELVISLEFNGKSLIEFSHVLRQIDKLRSNGLVQTQNLNCISMLQQS